MYAHHVSTQNRDNVMTATLHYCTLCLQNRDNIMNTATLHSTLCLQNRDKVVVDLHWLHTTLAVPIAKHFGLRLVSIKSLSFSCDDWYYLKVRISQLLTGTPAWPSWTRLRARRG